MSQRQALAPAAEYRLPALAEEVHASQAKTLLKVPDKDAEPLAFAVPVATDISVATHGTWTATQGGRLWRLTFRSDGATDLNFGFRRLHLPPGATLHLLSDTDVMPGYYDGAYTHRDNRQHGEFWSAPIPGPVATLELFVPDGAEDKLALNLTQVGVGFRDVFKLYGGPGLQKQGACNNDVVCPEGEPWRDPIRAVAAYTVRGIDTCTGTLIMDAEGTFAPFFLTAFHCGVTPGNAASVVTIWNYESPSCGQLGGGSRLQTVSGAEFRASRRDTDVALLELSAAPPPSFNPYWAGWDRSEDIPQGSVAIHHPGVDEKAISFNTDPLSYGNNCIANGDNTHWVVDNWEDGTTERGSSGSALFHPDNQGVIGFLSGGTASCSSITFDCYGRFGASWLGGSGDNQRLQPWLDPNNRGPLRVAGGDPARDVFRDGFEN
ncbi:MAG: hypothetical protein AAF358_02215 [Pseudomonadota bacterium]